MVLAGLVALPLSVSAQAAEEGATPEPSAQEPAPSAEPTPEEPALQIELDDDSVKLAPGSARVDEGDRLEEKMDLRVRRAGIGLGVSAAVLVGGGVMLGVGAANANIVTGEAVGLFAGGAVLTIGGLVGTIITGRMLAHRKRDRDRFREAHHGTPPRVQWDLARSQLVF
jgi:hypothetical protein